MQVLYQFPLFPVSHSLKAHHLSQEANTEVHNKMMNEQAIKNYLSMSQVAKTPMLSRLLPSERSSQHACKEMPTPLNHLEMQAAFAAACTMTMLGLGGLLRGSL